jgi:transcriptional regulator with XRE-family HTH domain
VSVLVENDVRAIRLLREEGWLLEELADEFGVGVTTVWKVVNGVTWGWVV